VRVSYINDSTAGLPADNFLPTLGQGTSTEAALARAIHSEYRPTGVRAPSIFSASTASKPPSSSLLGRLICSPSGLVASFCSAPRHVSLFTPRCRPIPVLTFSGDFPKIDGAEIGPPLLRKRSAGDFYYSLRVGRGTHIICVLDVAGRRRTLTAPARRRAQNVFRASRG